MHYINNLFLVFKYFPFKGAAEDVDLIWNFRMGIKIISFLKGMERKDSFLEQKKKTILQ